MITLQHTLSALESCDGNIEHLSQILPYVLLPDAIRAYTGARQYSHFEKTYDGNDVSFMRYPSNLKEITKDSIDRMKETDDYYLSSNIPKCVIGEETSVDTFVEKNMHLPSIYFNGVAFHLTQDVVFDDFVRNLYNCDRRFEDIFINNVTNELINGERLRNDIAKIESFGVYVLASRVYEKYGIITDQSWFDNLVIPSLKHVYPDGLSENTYKYMKIETGINEWIKNCDFSHLNDFDLPLKSYNKLYDEILLASQNRNKHIKSFSEYKKHAKKRIKQNEKKETIKTIQLYDENNGFLR